MCAWQFIENHSADLTFGRIWILIDLTFRQVWLSIKKIVSYNSFVFRRETKALLYQVLCKLHSAIYIVSLCHVCGLRLIKILFCSVLHKLSYQKSNRYRCLTFSALLMHTYQDTLDLFGPRREKTCLRSFRQSKIQTSLLSYRD